MVIHILKTLRTVLRKKEFIPEKLIDKGSSKDLKDNLV
jgi:hypothetical protein